MRVLVDMDGTLVDLNYKWIYYMNNRHKTQWKLEDIKTWDATTGNDWFEILRIPGFFADLPFMGDGRYWIENIAKRHELFIVTSPATWEAATDKFRWVHTNLRIPGIIPSMERLVLTRGKYVVRGDIMVDDYPKNLEKWKAENPEGYCILYDQPWNRDYDIRGRRDWDRAFSWMEVNACILMIEEKELKAAR